MQTILTVTVVILIALNVPLVLSNTKLKAQNTKLNIEKQNLEIELGKSLINKEEKDLSNNRIEKIKEMYKSTSEIKMPKQATKEDVEKFYESQRTAKQKKNRIIEK